MKEVSLAITGIQASISEWTQIRLTSEFEDLMMRLDVHSNSDDDLWTALTSGCFLDVAKYNQDRESPEFAVAIWWAQKVPLPTVDSVIAEWEEARATHLRSRDLSRSASLDRVNALLSMYERLLEEEEKVCQEALEFLFASHDTLELVTLALEHIYYDT